MMVEFKDGLALLAGEVSTYLFDSSNGEYLGTGTSYVTPGFGLPAGAVLDDPPDAPEGQVAAWRDDAWVLMFDHRGTVYSTVDGATVEFHELGDLPSTLTLLPRPSPAYVWGGDEWLLDAALDLEIKTQDELLWMNQELSRAREEIFKHEDQDPLAVASEEGWRRYRVELRAWPQHASFPDSSYRPVAPT